HLLIFFCFFFSSRRRHTRWPRDWSSDVCSSDLPDHPRAPPAPRHPRRAADSAARDHGGRPAAGAHAGGPRLLLATRPRPAVARASGASPGRGTPPAGRRAGRGRGRRRRTSARGGAPVPVEDLLAGPEKDAVVSTDVPERGVEQADAM